jgi:hypothetical protein
MTLPGEHGTTYQYRRGCRCDECRDAQTRAMRDYRTSPSPPKVNRGLLSDLLNDLFPEGMTSDSPLGRLRSERRHV